VSKNWLIAGGAIIGITAIGLSVGWLVTHRLKAAPPKTAAAVVSSVFAGPEITVTGRLQAQKTAQVGAPIVGILDAWFVDVGQEVYQDQLVGRIRNADLDNAVSQAQTAVDRAEMRIAQFEAQAAAARLEVSRTNADQIRAHNELDRIEKIYQRHKNLMDANAIARLTFEKTESDYNSAKAEAANRDASQKDAQDKAAALEHDTEEAKRALAAQAAALAEAKEAVAEGDLHSPADGVIVTRDVHQGDKVEEEQHLMTIATQLTKLAVSLTPEPAVLARIHAGQLAFVDGVKGQVREVKGAEVIVEFTSAAPVTKLGTPAQVRIVF
jgi:multidrug resistance efflux pump